MRRRHAGFAAALLPAALAMAPAGESSAAVTPRQVGSITFTSIRPGTVTGLRVSVEFQNPAGADEKPYSVASMVIQGPTRSVINTSVPPQCNVSDAQLLIQGPSACPPGSKVGGGTAVSDTGGGGGPLPRYQHLTVTDFNTRNGLIGFDQDNDPPGIRSVDHTTFNGKASTTVFPTYPGSPPPDDYTAVKSLQEYFPPYARNGHGYRLTPPTCPRVGYWTFTAHFKYRDGITQSIVSRSPCRRARTRRKRHRPHPQAHRHKRHHHPPHP